MPVHGRDHGGPHLQLQLVHEQAEVDVAHGHGQGRRSEAERVRVAPPVVGLPVLHEVDDEVQQDGAGEAGAVCHEFQDPDGQKFRHERLRQGAQEKRPLEAQKSIDVAIATQNNLGEQGVGRCV